jgi:hypothetical protein
LRKTGIRIKGRVVLGSMGDEKGGNRRGRRGF